MHLQHEADERFIFGVHENTVAIVSKQANMNNVVQFNYN